MNKLFSLILLILSFEVSAEEYSIKDGDVSIVIPEGWRSNVVYGDNPQIGINKIDGPNSTKGYPEPELKIEIDPNWELDSTLPLLEAIQEIGQEFLVAPEETQIAGLPAVEFAVETTELSCGANYGSETKLITHMLILKSGGRIYACSMDVSHEKYHESLPHLYKLCQSMKLTNGK